MHDKYGNETVLVLSLKFVVAKFLLWKSYSAEDIKMQLESPRKVSAYVNNRIETTACFGILETLSI